MKAVPEGKGRRSGNCWSHRAELAVNGLERTRFPPQLQRKCQRAPSAIHPSGTTHAGGAQISVPEGGHSHTWEFSSTLSWREESEVSQLQPPPNKHVMLLWFCISPASFCWKLQSQIPAFSLQLHMLSDQLRFKSTSHTVDTATGTSTH